MFTAKVGSFPRLPWGRRKPSSSKLTHILGRLAGLLVLGVTVPGLVTPQIADPPRRAARLGYVGGSVSFQPAGLKVATPAEVNRPFTSGDSFWSQHDGRGELQTENASIRFGAGTNLVIKELSNQATEIELKSGSLSVRLHTLAPQESFQIDTPNSYSFGLTRAGQYRVDIEEKGDELITVRFGEAEAFKVDGATDTVRQGMQGRISSGKIEHHAIPGLDEFDVWCIGRDKSEDYAVSAHYVSRDIPGYADLDKYGDWRTSDQYGAVWFPRNMDPDWVPNRFGHFIAASPWNMHWVEDKPWGFAPFHYGRWKEINGEWGWIPPSSAKAAGPGQQFAIRPYYTPSLVAWAKFAPGTVGTEAMVGWFPLGPGEAWKPGFETTPAYIERVNRTNTVIGENPDIRADYVNREAAITAMRSDDLANGRPVGKQFVRVPASASGQAEVTAGLGIQPTQEARIGPLGTAPAAPPEIANRAVVAHRMAAAPPAAPTLIQTQAGVRPSGGRFIGGQPREEAGMRVPGHAAIGHAPGMAAPGHAALGHTPGIAAPGHAALAHTPGTAAPAAHVGGLSGALQKATKAAKGDVGHGVKGAGSLLKKKPPVKTNTKSK